METEDIIELGSSDEEPGPPPPKKMNVRNAMVHIPTNLHGVTIKPVKVNSTELPNLGKGITVTKTTGSPASLPINRVKPPDKPLHKLGAVKKKIVGKKQNQLIQTKGKVFNPLSQIKKGIVQSVGNSTITKLKNPILINKPEVNKPQPLQRLPPSITITKTGPMVKSPPNIIKLPKPIPRQVPNLNENKTGRKRKLEVVQTVELDDEEASTSSSSPQWYVRPEEHSQKVIEVTHEETAASKGELTASQEDANNKEPEGPKFIEITIEDSPVKPAKTKRTRELSTEKVITIDDSPNKGSVVSEDIAEGSDCETNTKIKDPQSKKKLNYTGELQRIEEHTLEIEFEPIEPNEPNTEVNEENKIISLAPEIMEADHASVEIAQNKQGAVSVTQTKPKLSKQNSKEIPKKDVGMTSEFHPIYQSFISLCIQLENSNDMEKIVEKKIKTYYRQVPKKYRESDDFLDMVASKITAMEAAPEKMYLYIKDIVDELNIQRKIHRQVQVEEKKSEDQESFLYGKENELDPNKQRQIRKLEKTLKKLNRAIQKLENQEVDFDDEEDSVYLLTEKYKERMVRVHAKFCQLTNTKMPSQPRLVLDPRPGLSPAPAKRLEAWINKKDTVVFPDFHDVLRCVREANEENNLGWNEAFIMEEARDLFVRCGKKLQRRRQENEWRLATSRITPNSDPAEQSEDLRQRLEANRRLANTKETEVFNEFCNRQSQLKLEAEEIDDNDAEESPVESEEEDNDDNSSLESKQRRKERLRRLLQEQSKKNTPNKGPQIEQNVNKEIEIVIDSVESLADNKSERVNEEDKIQTLSDDTNEIGSDMDELHLLQKLHSDNEVRTVSTSDSSGSETPIAISDTLDSSSDDEKKTIPQPSGVISIENSSYSDDSDSQRNKPKKYSKYTDQSKEILQDIKELESCTSSFLKKKIRTNDVTTENTAKTSSEEESNPEDNVNSEKGEILTKTSQEEKETFDKDLELGIMSETAELCTNVDDCAKSSDAEDEQSMNSDIIDIQGSSTSSGQFEELLKEHNDDPLLKQPELIPRDPSDKLFDSLVMKHYNDPLVKQHLKGSSDSSNGGYPENSNSDTQSLNTSETTEDVKKDLMDSSVDTGDFPNVSHSMQIVDKLVEKIKQSDGSQSSDEALMKAVDEELDLMPDAGSPVTLALEKEVNLARQTKAWPRFRDECSLSSSEEDYTDDIVESKIDESTDGNFHGMDIAQKGFNQAGAGTSSGKTWNFESAKYVSERASGSHQSNAYTEPQPCSSRSTKDLTEGMDIEGVSTKDQNNCIASTSKEIDVACSDTACTEEEKPINTNACTSESTENASEDLDAADVDMTNAEADIECPKNISEPMDVAEIETVVTEVKLVDTCCSEQAREANNEEVITGIIPKNDTLEEQVNLDENKCELFSRNICDETSETDNYAMDESEEVANNDNDLISNRNLNINMNISANLSQKNVEDDEALDDLNASSSAEKDRSNDNISRTITSVCLQDNKGHD